MRVIITSVEWFGPPPVSTYTSVNTRSPRMAASVNRIANTGRSAGNATCHSRRHTPAPSTAADSYRLRSTPASPARKIIMSYGAPRQIPTTITDSRDVCSLWMNCDGPAPNQPSTMLTMPLSPG